MARWWNGNYGRLGRRDVYVRRGTLWEVEAREGGAEGRSKTFRFDSEDEAMAFVKRCLEGPGDWRQLSVSTSIPAPAAGATTTEEPQDTDAQAIHRAGIPPAD